MRPASLLATPALATLATAQTNSADCAPCHSRIAETYRGSGMARSFYRPTAKDFTQTATYYHKPSDSYFTTLQRDGKYYQRRYQLAPDGAESNVMEKRIDYIMGSGNNARAYLNRRPQHAHRIAPRLVHRKGRLLGHESRLRPPHPRRLPPHHHV